MKHDTVDFEPVEIHRKSKKLVIFMVMGMAMLTAGGLVAWKKRFGNASSLRGQGLESDEVKQWCALRQEWQRAVEPLASDIMLKSVRPADDDQRLALTKQRRQQCDEFAAKVRELRISDPNLQAAEIAMVRAGKIRANISVEIANALTQLDVERIEDAREIHQALIGKLGERIRTTREQSAAEIRGALAAVGGCEGAYHGPLTDTGTADDPYVSWDELDFNLKQSIKKFETKIHELEPQEQLANQVYHELIRTYRNPVSACYRNVKQRNPKIPEQMKLRVRLSRTGSVKSLAIEAMDPRDDRILDCLLSHAAKWSLPRPFHDGDYVVVNIDFNRFK